MKSLDNKILLPFLFILTLSLAVVGIVSYYGSYKMFITLLYSHDITMKIVDNETIAKQLLELQKYTIFVAIIAILAASQLTIFFSYSITKPIKKLVNACDEISKGNFSIDIEYDGKDEIALLKDAFLRMAKKLDNYVAEITKMVELNQKILRGVEYGIVVFDSFYSKLIQNEIADVYFSNIPELEKLVKNIIKSPNRQNNKGHNTLLYLKNKKGLPFYIEYHLNFIDNLIIFTFQDVTEKEKIKQNIEHINRLAFVGEMSAIIAHEIRNPLQGIKTSLQVLEPYCEKNETTNTLFSLLHQEIERIDGIITNLINYARPSEPNLESVEIKKAINECIMLVFPLAEKKRISFVTSFSNEEYILVDKNHFKQIMLNILTNAIKASNMKGKIKIGTISERDEICIYVKDYGMGIPPENLEKIFTPFFSTFTKGTGLGLSVVQTLVAKNNGHIKVESEVKRGTTVYLSFPRAIPNLMSENERYRY